MQENNIFPQLFPKPTGKNAYEDFCQAADLLKTSALWAEAQQRNTLSARRRALGDLPVRRARSLIATAMLKPLLPPERTIGASTTFPELAGFRDIARLLNAEIHVLFSEGKNAAALQSFAQGLRLGSAPKSQVLIGGLVGVAIDTILITRMQKHRDQLTLRDCDRVQVTLREHVEQDRGNASKSLAAELSLFEELRTHFEKGTLAEFQAQMDDDPGMRQLLNDFGGVLSDPVARRRELETLTRGAESTQTQAQAYLADPSTPLREPSFSPTSLAGALLSLVTPSYQRGVERLIQDRILCQLLYCQVALRRVWWETERYPETLESLKLGDWALDPYTRQPFRYEKKGDGYTLASAGPLGDDGQRVPVTLPLTTPTRKN